MAVVLRLQRQGKKIQPNYRIVAIDKRKGASGKPIEVIGNYNPKAEKNTDKITIKMERYDHWVKIGAKPSSTLVKIINKTKTTN